MRFGKRRGGEAPEGEPTVEAPPAPVVEPEPAAAEAEAVVEGEAVELPYEPPVVEEPPPEPVPAMSAYDAPVAAYEPPISDPVEPAPAARLADSPPYHEPGVNPAAGGAWPEPAFDPAERPEILLGAAFGGGLLLALILRRLETDSPTHDLSQTVQEISERASLLVREEIELAKAEITEKVTKLLKGAAVAVCAGIFVVTGMLFLLHGFAWLAWFALPVGTGAVFWGFFIVAGLLFLLGGIAGYLAARFLREGKPPTPDMAIDEAGKIKRTFKFKRRKS